ncbi:hypothetical protein niasHS_017417 [Heterodera schachtii]|uniref:N-acetylglucosaminylphosphatidylinositol deacetylase n=1 Tax=Heterodera schachtii TaxID=97005 RepID=A0ABD2I8G2_HETSC
MQKAFKFFFTAFLVSLLSVALHFYFDNKTIFPAKFGERWLLLIAHPDDETMFFGPTLLFLSSIGVQLHLLCITSGNSEGLGTIRRNELYSSASVYGIQPKYISFVDPEERRFPDGFHDWNTTSLSALIYSYIRRLKPDGLITFDEWGISGHPNHRDSFKAILNLNTEGKLKELGLKTALALKSVAVLRKYTGAVDLFLNEFGMSDGNTFVTYSANPLRIYWAMLQHRSQLLWFRYLYMAISRYIYLLSTVLQKPIYL